MKKTAVDPAQYEPRLRARLAELEARLHGIEHALDAEPNPDFSERASEREGDEVLESLGAAGVQEIRMIRAALERIAEGDYGYCVKCGDPIPAARLDIIPHTPHCAKCA